jgi:hypothetical protein
MKIGWSNSGRNIKVWQNLLRKVMAPNNAVLPMMMMMMMKESRLKH